MALGILKGAWRSLLLSRLLPGELHGASSLPLVLRGSQAAQAAPQRCASHSASRGALLAPTAGEHVWSGLGAAAHCEASADARTDARSVQSPRAAEGWARAGELPGTARALQDAAATQAEAHGPTCLRPGRPALAQQLRQSPLAELHSTAGLHGAPCLWRRQQQRGFVNFLPGLNGDVSKRYHERRLIGCAPCFSHVLCRSSAADSTAGALLVCLRLRHTRSATGWQSQLVFVAARWPLWSCWCSVAAPGCQPGMLTFRHLYALSRR